MTRSHCIQVIISIILIRKQLNRHDIHLIQDKDILNHLVETVNELHLHYVLLLFGLGVIPIEMQLIIKSQGNC